ncbi:hypothetical protein FUAX_30340 [Fulvitalea axinellae]|uniref:YtxH domain-containing protein n=1 Tax=Fulvitalea axinellae TaxID=1182444 RepID=A0AAU9CRI8_9BACT|nr:hypothetical protein FUAX_30340 [Fulvitalea axinellae]
MRKYKCHSDRAGLSADLIKEKLLHHHMEKRTTQYLVAGLALGGIIGAGVAAYCHWKKKCRHSCPPPHHDRMEPEGGEHYGAERRDYEEERHDRPKRRH